MSKSSNKMLSPSEIFNNYPAENLVSQLVSKLRIIYFKKDIAKMENKNKLDFQKVWNFLIRHNHRVDGVFL